MEFNLDPSSGFADSYLDVEFSVSIPEHPKSTIRIRNETSGDDLQILGSSSGYILNGEELVIKNKKLTSGHINIFNHDKMNKKFLSHQSVTLKCIAEFYDNKDDKIGEEEDSVTFYNEVHSLDAGIIPFDLVIHNKSVDIANNESLNIDIISDLPKKYELCVSSLDEKMRCHIEVSARKGKTYVEIPGEFLYYDLGLRENKKRKFKIFYVKYQGTNISRMANRRYLPIQNTNLDFQVSDGLTPKPQTRLGPTGKSIGTEFIISSRYLVMCPRKSSGFSQKSEFGKEKLMNLTMMINEGQHMNSLSKKIQQFSTNQDADNIQKTQRALNMEQQAQKQMRRPQIEKSQIQLMQSVSGVYDTVSAKIRPQAQQNKQPYVETSKAQTFATNQTAPKKGGCGCSRKK